MARLPKRADWLAALALLTLDLAAYGRLLDPNRMLADFDAFVYFYPLRAYAAAAIQEGRLPLWNPSSFLGVPFIANPQTAVFYPPTALFFWLPVPWAYGLNLVLHVFLAGLFFYFFLRVCFRLLAPAALLGAAAFMLGGTLAGQYGHLNQLSAAAWLPLILLVVDQAVARRCLRLAALGALLFSLQLLAGHPQQSYMTAIAFGWVALWRAWANGWRGLPIAVGIVAITVTLGAGLAAVQLVPTAELAIASIRGGGLSYRDAVANSLWPWLVARALLPSFANDLGSTELLGYVGVVPLMLGAIALGAGGRRHLCFAVPLVVGGVFLALGGANPVYGLLFGVVPGLASFRVPARWLLLYSVGAATLAGLGLHWLLSRPRLSRAGWSRLVATLCVLALVGLLTYLGGARAVRSVQLAWALLGTLGLALAVGCALPRTRTMASAALLAIVGLELWAAGADLPPRSPVPAEAYAQPRDSTMFLQSKLAGGRLLSIASEDYELKEAPDYREWFADLSQEALVAFLVAAKRNEILTPNVNLLYRIDDVDGYDGGLLPLQRWLRLAELLLPADRVRADGALISRLESLPPRRLMDLLNLRVVLAGRARDHVADGASHDRSVLATLGPGERLTIERVPARAFDGVALISWLDGASPADGDVVAELELVEGDGKVVRVPLLAGRDTTDGRRRDEPLSPSLEELRPWKSTAPEDPAEFLAQVPAVVQRLERLAIRNLTGDARLNVRALSLFDTRDGAWTSLVLDDRLERTAFFDMKVYEYPGVLGRAYLVRQANELDDDAALERLARSDFEPRREAVVEPGTNLSLTPGGTGDTVEIVEGRAERVRIRTRADGAALLVLSDAYYPGWKVSVDGQLARLIRTNLAFRGVAVPAGEHEVVFSYEPESFRLGLALTALSGFVLVLLGARGSLVLRRPGRLASGPNPGRERGGA